jgi:PAS domain-containing protein
MPEKGGGVRPGPHMAQSPGYAMKIEQESYAEVIASLHDGLYFVDRDRKVIYWNKAAQGFQ